MRSTARLARLPAAHQRRGPGLRPDFHVSRAVANIFESVRRQLFEKFGLGRTLVVGHAVAADRAIENAKARRDANDRLLIGSRYQPYAPAHGLGPAAARKHGLVHRQGADLKLGPALQSSLHLGDRKRQLDHLQQCPQRTPAQVLRNALEQGVGQQERAIEVHRQGQAGVVIGDRIGLHGPQMCMEALPHASSTSVLSARGSGCRFKKSAGEAPMTGQNHPCAKRSRFS